MKLWCAGLAVGLISAVLLRPASAQRCTAGCEILTYPSSISNDANGPLDLKAFVFYPRTIALGSNAPIAVLMHGYSGTDTFAGMRPQAERLAAQGFVSIVVAMRGRDGSDGIRDSGGLEIHDIYDAVESVKSGANYVGKVNPDNVHITGWSGGGGNVMSALTKFPDYFNLGSSYFGMSDYGLDPVNGWYQNGANVGIMRTNILDVDVGNPNTGGPAVQDRYMARASNLASKNNPYSEIHLFVNPDETICPPVNHSSYLAKAIAGSSVSEFDNITNHVGASNGSLWQDWNGDTIKQSNEQFNWPHSDSINSQIRGEEFYLTRLKNNLIPAPVLNASDELYVAGFVKTKPFELFLGDGQNAAGELNYELAPNALTFQLEVLSSNTSAGGQLTVDTTRLPGQLVDVVLNGQTIDRVPRAADYRYSFLRDGDTLVLRAVTVPEPSTLLLLGGGAVGAAKLFQPRRMNR